MDAELNVLGVLEVAGRIETNRARLYRRHAELSDSPGPRNLCCQLAAWSRKRVRKLRHRRTCLHYVAPRADTAPNRDFVYSHPGVLAGLAFFASNEPTSNTTAIRTTTQGIPMSVIRMSEQAVVFYEGLKGFTQDPMARDVLKDLVQEEKHHLRQMTRQTASRPRTGRPESIGVAVAGCI